MKGNDSNETKKYQQDDKQWFLNLNNRGNIKTTNEMRLNKYKREQKQ